MYIGVKDQKIVFMQMELGDFFNKTTKKIFDLKNPKENRKASIVLKPKGLARFNKRRKRELRAKIKEQFQPRFITVVNNENPTITITKNSNIEIEQKSKPKKRNKKRERKKKKIKKTNHSSQFSPQLSENHLLSAQTTAQSNNQDDRSNSQYRDLLAFSSSRSVSVDSYQPSPLPTSQEINKKKAKSTQVSQKEIEEQKKPLKLSSPIEYTIPDNITRKFGHTGDIPIPCPYCNEEIWFFPEDLDSVHFHSTRLCDCGAIVRISTREYYNKIFSNLFNKDKSQEKNLDIEILATALHDNEGNTIYSYGFKPIE
ncbi:MAG: hypothetical protein K9W44_00885 [Candidatus Lokiarchaeota archaeon]|nr:hypothetical protein [Candidatus Harpocratesius repetitus]